MNWRSILRSICLVGLTFAGTIAAVAAPPPGPPANPGGTEQYPTRFANTGKSLDVLLNMGFRVVSSHLGIDTIGYVLEHDGKWVTCSLSNPDKSTPDQMLSQCFAMN